MKVLLVFFSIYNIIAVTQSSKILGFFPFPATSHYILGNSLMKGLAESGHDVTVISSLGEKNAPRLKTGSYRNIVLTGIYEDMQAKRDQMNMFDMAGAGLNPVLNVGIIAYIFTNLTEDIYSHPTFQHFIQSEEKFDAVIVEQFFNEADKVISAHFGAPLIVLSTVGANNWLNHLVGNPSPASYIPDVLLSYSNSMSFYERLKNTLVITFSRLINELYVYPKHKAIVEKYIPNPPNLYNVMYNISLLLMNSHPSINQPVPYVPSMVDICGFHVTPPKALPEDLQSFLDDAGEEGVIYFSMGSNLKSSELPPEKRDAFLKVFSKLKQKILWKWEDDTLPRQPVNLKLGKWLPQQDILAHPNLKLFITHGGFLSTTETIYHGVPVLAIPIVGDQKLNAQAAVNNGYGISLPYTDVNEESLEKKLNELLHNPKYKNNAKARSRLFHDRPIKPMDLAVYWVEYVIRHRGTPHLKVGGLELPWYQYYLLDVIGVICLAVLIGLYINYFIIIFIWQKLFKQKPKQKVKKN